MFIGNSQLITNTEGIVGKFIEIEGEKYYQIQNYDDMPDFFMNIVSDSNHWLFISSNGSLTAGRKNRDNALFPYYTVDKIHDYKNITGSKTYILVEKEGKTFLWEPFTDDSKNFYKIIRNLYKSNYGNKLIFEEVNHDFGLSFRYGWYNSEKFGFVKKSCVINNNKTAINIEVLDGIQNILPYGVDYNFQNEYSNLLDAYKKNEQIQGSTLGLFILSSIPVDRAEPSEALKATSVWSYGFDNKSKILISDKQVNNFKKGLNIEPEYDIRASRGSYFVNASIYLDKNTKKEWFTVAEINQDSTDISNLTNFIRTNENLDTIITEDINNGTINLKKMVASADGFQLTNTDLCCARHYSNTLYNIMRGGIFINDYLIETEDFKQYLWQINRLVTKETQKFLDKLPNKISYLKLISLVEQIENPNLLRITYEYLPLTFSRRHGDPSRPWNLFSIETKNEKGDIKYYYEGNWRDIFQNWEALCLSYPDFVEGIISKFVNASTIDGYNPYRIMRDGIDWEAPNPNDPWSYIGYWGDHQIIYLQKLLELSNNFHPGKIEKLLTSEIFTYANVPYRIKSYDEIVKNPKDTVVFDEELNNKINSEVKHIGADARLLKNRNGDKIYKVNFTEKILATLLSKLSNFIPGAGIWLNTQRPEWNDANNALVGNGTSMVTLYYLRRFLKFWQQKFNSLAISEITVSEEIATLFETIHNIFIDNLSLLETGFSDSNRRKISENLGQAHSKYRNEIYNYSFSGEKKKLKIKDLVSFSETCLKYIDKSIKENKREDGLYHSYNLISFTKKNISIRNLYEMLEGQVAVLSSGVLSSEESLDLLNSLKNSSMYREDQYSYMLYPDRKLARFIEKNIIPKNLVMKSPLLKKLIEDGETSIIKVDETGNYHFSGLYRNANDLELSLNKLKKGDYSHLIENEKEKILSIYEDVFDHKSFTGRSGTFYGYEGLGSIYWHMVSKLLLATQECFYKAINEGADPSIIGQLQNHYYEIKAGIGLYKKPDLYGAFPTDAYSHTPSNSGVKQPGLTGQVKEEFISRMGEMGVIIKNGKILFDTSLLNKEEILDKKKVFEYYSLRGEWCKINLSDNQLGFTFCQVPVIYTFSDNNKITVLFIDGKSEKIDGNSINKKLSNLIFNRDGSIKLVEVTVKK
ncbi:MAG: hypothetical protein DRJ01_08135 [Bacteroidetes bacterium]|nr:MAG: hypothetical protein DRJ01_08135 [Bacteroidota bacterium]